MKGQLRINQLFAFVIVDEDGTEGVPAIWLNGTWFPLMGADMARVEDLKRIVAADPMYKGKRVTIQRFGHRETIGTIDRTQEPAVPSITCPTCSRVSYNPTDIRERYCGFCHRFHSDPRAPVSWGDTREKAE